MKVLLVYSSYHRMNTEKVVRAMAEASGATLMRTEEVRPEDLDEYDLVGFASGIYGGKHHLDLLALAARISPAEREVFLVSTAGGESEAHHRALREALTAKGRRIVGEFQCPGEYRIFRIFAMNRGRPDEKDLSDARRFVRGLVTTQAAAA